MCNCNWKDPVPTWPKTTLPETTHSHKRTLYHACSDPSIVPVIRVPHKLQDLRGVGRVHLSGVQMSSVCWLPLPRPPPDTQRCLSFSSGLYTAIPLGFLPTSTSGPCPQSPDCPEHTQFSRSPTPPGVWLATRDASLEWEVSGALSDSLQYAVVGTAGQCQRNDLCDLGHSLKYDCSLLSEFLIEVCMMPGCSRYIL